MTIFGKQSLQVPSFPLVSSNSLHHDEVVRNNFLSLLYSTLLVPIKLTSIFDFLFSWSFEATVAAIYDFIGKPKATYNKVEQLGVSAAAG